jgi:hypothetical protein
MFTAIYFNASKNAALIIFLLFDNLTHTHIHFSALLIKSWKYNT